MSQLRAYFERWQRLEDERKALGDDLKELFSEAKGNGFAPKAMRIAFRSIVAAENESDGDRETAAQVELYVAEITGPRAHPAPARTREITEQPETAPIPVAKAGEDADHTMLAATTDPASRGEDVEDRQPLASPGFAGEREPASGQPVSAEQEPAPISRRFRPHCQHPERCGSSDITKHCWSCQASIDAGRVLA